MISGFIQFCQVHWRRLFVPAVFILLLVLRIKRIWPFEIPSMKITSWKDLIQFILADRTVVGIFRLSIITFGFYVVLSMVSHIVSGRWISGFSSSGIEIDKVIELKEEQVDTRTKIILEERDEALNKNAELRKQILNLNSTIKLLENLLNKLEKE